MKENEEKTTIMSGYYIVNGIAIDKSVKHLEQGVHFQDPDKDDIQYVSTCEVVDHD